MPEELKDIIRVAVGTVSKPKFEIYDSYGSTLELIEPETRWKLVNATTGTIVIDDANVTDGLVEVNNSDTDAAGNTIRTVQILLDLKNTDITAGRYWIVLDVAMFTSIASVGGSLINHEDKFKMQLDIVDYDSVGAAVVS